MTKYVFLLILSFQITSYAANNDVLVRAWAADDYIRPLGLDGKPMPETCLFHQGEYLAGDYERSNNPSISFNEVADTLQKELAKKNYLMSNNDRSADFVLIVHWGLTSEETEEYEMINSSGGEDSFDDTVSIDVVSETTRKRNSLAIGTRGSSNVPEWSIKGQRLAEAEQEERYFINVFAFSIAELKARTKDSPKLMPKWITQMSIPTRRNKADAAFAMMAQTAGSYFGDNVEGVDFIPEGAGRGKVTIGELEYLGIEEDSNKK
ncbi:MAG: hypothetical protein NWR76_03400 [Opitutales bacterium]|nr:hypothetical protein [Opitutales bacterium]